MGFSRQEYWSVLSCPPPGDLPDPGTKPRSSTLQANSLPYESPGKPLAMKAVAMTAPPSWPNHLAKVPSPKIDPLGLGFNIWICRRHNSQSIALSDQTFIHHIIHVIHNSREAENKVENFMCCAWSLSRVWLFATPWIIAHQAPLSMRILQARKLHIPLWTYVYTYFTL